MSNNNSAPSSSPANKEEKKEESSEPSFFYFDTVIVGAGAAGIGVVHALLRGGVDPEHILLLEQGPDVGTSFRAWHKTTKFISPSWPSYPFGPQDLNAVVPDTAVHAENHPQHPTGDEYADYLHRMLANTGIMAEFENTVTKLQKMRNMFLIHTSKTHVVMAKNVVWAGGEWHSPTVGKLTGDSFEEGTFWHYKFADLSTYDPKVHTENNPVIIVGGGEAGADIACALAKMGVHVTIVEASAENDEEDLGAACAKAQAEVAGSDSDDSSEEEEYPNRQGAALDPSRNLSPITQDRLEAQADLISIQWSTKCTATRKVGENKIEVDLLTEADCKTDTLTTTNMVILCTGFDVSQNPVIKELFEWDDGSPVVTPTYDESTIMPGLFLAGPMLMHSLQPTCGIIKPTANEREGEKEDNDEGTLKVEQVEKKEELATKEASKDGEEKLDDENIIFCFVYKYRTRFAVLATKIIHRVLQDRHLANKEDAKKLDVNQDRDYWDQFAGVEFTEEGQVLRQRLKRMQFFYRMKGMYLTDLSCSQLACGMSTQDAPNYDEIFAPH
mmetsp:Transcript_20168/g.49458  ORF Transcript_20168/g.49458 Transcript_20168/m.49458 type:complete len:556 (+) Transcript_20168:1086-2753(+)